MAKYYGKWEAGTSEAGKPYESNNKEKLIKEMRKIANGNRQRWQVCFWEVWTIEDNNICVVARGGTTPFGKMWREQL